MIPTASASQRRGRANLLTVVGLEALQFLVPLVVTLAVFGFAASLLQNAPRMVLERIKPRVVANLARSAAGAGYSERQGLIEFAKSLFKLVSVTRRRRVRAALVRGQGVRGDVHAIRSRCRR